MNEIAAAIPSIVASVATSVLVLGASSFVALRVMRVQFDEFRNDMKTRLDEQEERFGQHETRMNQLQADMVNNERRIGEKLALVHTDIARVAQDVAYLRGKAEREQRS